MVSCCWIGSRASPASSHPQAHAPSRSTCLTLPISHPALHSTHPHCGGVFRRGTGFRVVATIAVQDESAEIKHRPGLPGQVLRRELRHQARQRWRRCTRWCTGCGHRKSRPSLGPRALSMSAKLHQLARNTFQLSQPRRLDGGGIARITL